MKAYSEEKKGIKLPFGFHYVVIVMTFLGSMVSYFSRVSFSVALVAMVNYSNKTNQSDDGTCAKPEMFPPKNDSLLRVNETSDIDVTVLSSGGDKFNWEHETQSFMLAALFYGCMVSQLLSGVLTQRFGIRWIFGVSTLVSSALCMLTPPAAILGPEAVITIRFVQGFLQGALLPVQSQAVSLWSPPKEKSRAFTFVSIGIQAGIVVGMFTAGLLADSNFLGGWPSIFYVFGVVGCLWSVLWMVLVTDSPEQHWCVTHSELEHIQGGRQAEKTKSATVPWKRIFTSIPVWSCTLGIAGHSVAFFLLITELPMYLTKVLHFDIKASGALSAAPFLSRSLMAMVGGYIADALHKRLSITAIRKIMSALGFFGCALPFLGIAYSGCRAELIVVLLCVASGMTGLSISGILVAAVDMSPTFSATITGISTTFAFFVGALMPYAVSIITSSGQTVENWSTVFIVSAVLISVGGIQFLIFGKADRQPWDPVRPSNDEVFVKSVLETPEIEITRF